MRRSSREDHIKLIAHGTETFYGVIKAGIVFHQVLAAFENTTFYGSGFGVVVDKSSGEIVSAKDTTLLGQPLKSYVSEAVYQALTTQATVNNYILTTFNGVQYYIGYYTDASSEFLTLIMIPVTLYTPFVDLVNITFISFAVIAGIISVVISLVVGRSLAKPMGQLAVNSKKMASGDLTVELRESRNKNEIGQLNQAFRDMVTFLRPTVLQILNIAENVTTSAQEMASSAEEVNASSEEISSIAQQMSRGSQQQTDQINIAVKQSGDMAVQFEEQVQGIEAASEIIETISGQVNMLALNASIEAARAGEYGRGFAVVADNIRRLADEVKQSLTRVNEIIVGLRQTMSKAIGTITNSVQNAAAISEETAAGAEEASAVTEEQAATMQEMSASAQELARIALDLETLVKRFTV